MSDESNPEIAAPGHNYPEDQTEKAQESSKTLIGTEETRAMDTDEEKIVVEGEKTEESEAATDAKLLLEENHEPEGQNDELSTVTQNKVSREGSWDFKSLADIMMSEPEEMHVENMFLTEESDEEKKEETVKESDQKKSFEQSKSFEKGLRVTPPMSPKSTTSLADSYESEIHSGHEPEAAVQEVDQIDRNMYYELYALYTKKMETEKRKNRFLQARLADYYKRKRMYHVLLSDPATQTEYQKKYDQLLDELDNAIETSAREQATAEGEVHDLQNKCQFRSNDIKALLEKLQKAEKDFCKEIISGEADPKSNTEKILDRYLRRQRLQVANLSQIRLDFIRLRNKYNDKQAELDALNNLGPNLHLIDYEQMKCDNRNLHDKLEEKELILSGLRRKCQNVMQILAHNREKSSALDTDIESISEQLESVTDEFMDAREQLNTLKQERDSLRQATTKMKENSGLLTKPKLLRDMENAIRDTSEGWDKLREYKEQIHMASAELALVKSEHIFEERKSLKPQMPKKRMSVREVA